jgi:hypothetical protein
MPDCGTYWELERQKEKGKGRKEGRREGGKGGRKEKKEAFKFGFLPFINSSLLLWL